MRRGSSVTRNASMRWCRRDAIPPLFRPRAPLSPPRVMKELRESGQPAGRLGLRPPRNLSSPRALPLLAYLLTARPADRAGRPIISPRCHASPSLRLRAASRRLDRSSYCPRHAPFCSSPRCASLPAYLGDAPSAPPRRDPQAPTGCVSAPQQLSLDSLLREAAHLSLASLARRGAPLRERRGRASSRCISGTGTGVSQQHATTIFGAEVRAVPGRDSNTSPSVWRARCRPRP